VSEAIVPPPLFQQSRGLIGMWVLSDSMLSTLEGFHHRVARCHTGKRPFYLPREDQWVYPLIDDVLKDADLFTMTEYISRRRNYLVQYVATRPILDLCRVAERLPGSPLRWYWWDQVDLDGG